MSRTHMLADLKRSGITKTAHINKLKLKVLSAPQTEKLTGFKVAAYQIPYFGVDGKKIDYWRVRYLEEIKGKFGATKKKPPRYSQSKDTIPHLYFPPLLPWSKIATDTEIPIVITEGEKKAAAACLHGIACLGVGGVWAWKSKKHNLRLIPDFKKIKLKGRTFYLCFDNDINDNPLVIDALNALAKELVSNGAKVAIKYLPAGDAKGLDDWLVAGGTPDEFRDELETMEFSQSALLFSLQERLAFIKSKNAVYDLEQHMLYPNRQALVSLACSNITRDEVMQNGNTKKVNVAGEWLDWQHRREYDALSYLPGEGEVVDSKLNLWRGWGCEPVKGNAKPAIDLVNYLCGEETEFKAWLWQWLAYPIQFPGTKLFTAVVFHSPQQGVGKTFLGQILGDIYGSNYTTADQTQIHSTFNDWIVNRQFILGEEITGSDKRADADRLKNMLTREKISVNKKFQPEYELPDCANYMFTSNHDDAFFIEQYDRRFAVLAIEQEPAPLAFYQKIDAWKRNGGASALFYHLLNNVDVADFNPKAPAPSTQAKIEMRDLSRTDLDIFAHMLVDAPDTILNANGIATDREIYTLQQLKNFLPDEGRFVTNIALSKALKRARFKMLPVHTTLGTQKLWAIRNVAHWRKQTKKEWGDYFTKLSDKTKKFKA